MPLIFRPGDLGGQLPTCLDETCDHVGLQHLVIGYEQLHKSGLLSSALGTKAAAHALSQQIIDTVFQVRAAVVVIPEQLLRWCLGPKYRYTGSDKHEHQNLGPIHTVRAAATQANGTWCCDWEYQNQRICTQSNWAFSMSHQQLRHSSIPKLPGA